MTSETNVTPEAPAGAESRWGVYAHPAFTVILVATTASAVGVAMYDTASSWLMTGLSPSPRLVSAVQVATTLPMFLLTIPAGALSDVVDPRRLLLLAQIAVAIISIAFASLVSAHLATPSAVLAASFALGLAGALAAPAWLVITPMLVPRPELDSAVAINSATYNIARAIGPAIAGFAIATYGIALPFWCDFAGNVAVVAALLWWREPQRRAESMPAERFMSAMTTGLRYVRNSREMDSTLIRAVAFFPFASAYLALLPLVARDQLHNGGPELYGALMAAIGLGSIAASFALNWLKARLGPDRLAGLGTIGTVVALLLFAAARQPAVAFVGSFIVGASSIIMLAVLFVSAQVALPEWVRGRGLSIFLTAYFGAMTLGSAVWGQVASLGGLPLALSVAGAGAFIGMLVTWPWKLQTGAALNLAPSLHWRAPVFVSRLEDDQGPILVVNEYTIDPKDSAAFLAVMSDVALERKRDGAYAWNIFEDPDHPGEIVEAFLIHSLRELWYRQARFTVADEMMENQANQFLKVPKRSRYLVGPKRASHSWRGRLGVEAPDRQPRLPG